MQNTTQKQTLTNVEKTFIVEFISNAVYSLTQINASCVLEKEEHFVRLQDATEVLDNLQMLYSTASNENAVFNFTIAQAAQALCCYDTEYRETICEQFEHACTLELYAEYKNTNANFKTLAERLYDNY
jgi:chloramphenicol O-acetyltransferase